MILQSKITPELSQITSDHTNTSHHLFRKCLNRGDPHILQIAFCWICGWKVICYSVFFLDRGLSASPDFAREWRGKESLWDPFGVWILRRECVRIPLVLSLKDIPIGIFWVPGILWQINFFGIFVVRPQKKSASSCTLNSDATNHIASLNLYAWN